LLALASRRFGTGELQTKLALIIVKICLVDAALALSNTPAILRNTQIFKRWRSMMSEEFEKLRALLCWSEPGDRELQVDRGTAAKLAARCGWILRRVQEQRAQSPKTGSQTFEPRPDHPTLRQGDQELN
jgi:hypothetical protein